MRKRMSVHIYFLIANMKSEFLAIYGNLKEKVTVTVTVPVQIEGL